MLADRCDVLLVISDPSSASIESECHSDSQLTDLCLQTIPRLGLTHSLSLHLSEEIAKPSVIQMRFLAQCFLLCFM
jgi:hypothetical protein